jgi:radical SAM protein with 4Fe4S-binding SPASM domain
MSIAQDIPSNDFIEFRKKILSSFKVDNNIMSALQIVDINITELCTRKCVFCPRHDSSIYPNRKLNMSVETYVKLARDLAEFNYSNQIVLAGFSEPLLHKEIFDILRIFKEYLPHNKNLTITTNGDLLTEKTVCGLFENGLDLLKMSLYDGPEQEEHFLKLFEKCNIDSSKYVIKRFWYGPEEEYGMSGISNRVGMMKLNDKNVPNRACFMPFNSAFIDWNGDVLLCTHNWSKDIKHGNINDSSLKDIWLGDSVSKIRKHHLQIGRCGLKPCQNCEVHGQVYGENSFKAFKKFYS